MLPCGAPVRMIIVKVLRYKIFSTNSDNGNGEVRLRP